jgi:hypothetical protein
MLPTSTQSVLNFRLPATFWLLAFISVCALAQTASAQPRPSAPQEAIGASTIRGRVIYADTSRPLRRAEVSLVSETTGNWSETAVTNRNGEFVFTDLSAGKYFVVVSAPDIVSPRSLMVENSSLADQIALGQIENGFSEVTVDGSSSAKTEIRAARGGVITGRVLSEDDTPIAGAAIRLFQLKEGRLARGRVIFADTGQPLRRAILRLRKDFNLDYQKRTISSKNGDFVFAGLAAGTYYVEVDANGIVSRANGMSFSNLGFSVDEAMLQQVTVDGDNDVKTEIRVTRGGAITGRISCGDGEPETRDVNIKFDGALLRVSGSLKWKRTDTPVNQASVFLRRIDDPQSDLDLERFLRMTTPPLSGGDNDNLIMREMFLVSPYVGHV